MIFLTLDELLHVGWRALGTEPVVRDHGLLESALARPQSTFSGRDVYETLEVKAAALVHSVVTNHGLVDGDKRLGLSALIAFLGLNGRRLTMTNDGAYDLIDSIASGDLSDVNEIATLLVAGSAAY